MIGWLLGRIGYVKDYNKAWYHNELLHRKQIIEHQTAVGAMKDEIIMSLENIVIKLRDELYEAKFGDSP